MIWDNFAVIAAAKLARLIQPPQGEKGKKKTRKGTKME